jgi:putative ABC transport system substrate-binding protein
MSRPVGRAFETLIQNRTNALLIAPDSVFFNRRILLATLATRHAVPAIYPWREAVEIGGLMSYGTNLPDVYRQLGIYTGLKGASPSDLPVVQPTKLAQPATRRRRAETPLVLVACSRARHAAFVL